MTDGVRAEDIIMGGERLFLQPGMEFPLANGRVLMLAGSDGSTNPDDWDGSPLSRGQMRGQHD